ncbi:CDP-glucose 4,6-dehydratase [Trinickia sp. EG282A]|uniref:CDP-glucose 4,6-dehydratase n=1 Tax=Trinickia sp. EG282A TaxID=3237013 RepID=UPI0034D1D6C7
MTSSSFWHGRRVFLSGHTGFKGSWLALWLSYLGARTTGYALPAPTVPNLYELAAVGDRLTSVLGDINDLDHLSAAMKAAEPEVVFHLAAQALVREGYAHPAATFATNVMGTVNVLEAVRRVPSVKSVIVVTSDKCYRDQPSEGGCRETDALGGQDPYSASKAAAELVSLAYRSSFFEDNARIVTVRAGNVIGGGDFARDRLLPDIVRAVEHRAELEIRYPDAIRPWQFVLEPLRGYLELAERASSNEAGVAGAWNFGPDEAGAQTVREVVRGFVDACAPYQPPEIHFGASRPQYDEAMLLKLDTAKARAQLGWRPLVDFNATLAMTAEWYRAYFERSDMCAVSERQLERYLDNVGQCGALSGRGIA